MEAERSGSPKLNPETVTEARPECGVFEDVNESIAASNVTPPFNVPITPATVTLAMSSTGMPLLPGDVRQAKAVADNHELLAQAAYPS